MMWAALQFAGGWLKNAISALFGFIREYPWQFACIALCCLSLWFLHGRSSARDELADRIAAEKAATGAQRRVNDAAQVHYEGKADEADKGHAVLAASAHTASDVYIASHRVRADCAAGQAPAATIGDHSAVPAKPASETVVVAVADTDVRICAADYAYARSAYEWAQSLKLPESLLPGTTTNPDH